MLINLQVLSDFRIVANGRAAERPMSEETLLQRVEIPLGSNVYNIDNMITDKQEYLGIRYAAPLKVQKEQAFGRQHIPDALHPTHPCTALTKTSAFRLRTDADISPHHEDMGIAMLRQNSKPPLESWMISGCYPLTISINTITNATLTFTIDR